MEAAQKLKPVRMLASVEPEEERQEQENSGGS